MNLFLLFAVPLAAVAVHRLLHAEKNPISDPKSWVVGAVWSIASLLVASFFGKWREFSGSLPGVFCGMTLTDVLLVPGIVIAAWYFTRKQKDPWELALWLSIVFTLAGIRDFASTARTYDLTEYFLIPLDRILVLLTFPNLMAQAMRVEVIKKSWVLWTLAGMLVWTGALFPVLSFAGWGWVVWVLTAGGIGGSLWFQKKAAPQGSGPSV